jgi:hypothetical protein
MNIGIVVLATNAYFVLAVRLIKKFVHHYKGSSHIRFYIFSDEDPSLYLPESIDFEHRPASHSKWIEATNDKFDRIISLENCDRDYLYYLDADTSVSKDFDESKILGDLVGAEHFGNRTWLANGAGYDKNPKSKAYVPPDTGLPCTYYHAAFFGGTRDRVVDFSRTLRAWQIEDNQIPYEPAVNDESYVNAFFHYNMPMTVALEDFPFDISHKGGLEETRNVNLDVSDIKSQMREWKHELINLENGKVFRN